MHPNPITHLDPPHSTAPATPSRRDPLVPVQHTAVSILLAYSIILAKATHKIRFPQALACSEQLVARRATDDEILREVDTPNTIKPTDERLPRLLIDASNNRADEERPEAALVQRAGHQVGEGRRGDVALLAQAVHVDLVAEQVGNGADVRGQPRQPKVDVAVGEDLGEVVGDGEGLQAEAEIARDRYAVLADHGHAGAAI